ncbi:OprO/OprP family phosphate-selective porin [Gallaecimonas pentaromativorans]|uniref:Phosphate-selective porin OprO/OprP n=1 Tax=Gallaecimonas pentaromativorans TaxID=584787 RepID=A0A3N1PDI5_9GAMM|nr:porin [Gallaecimonas pentaromativorans]ROQ25067.1 phosphate-selective porin OprO/OprP [Gallaecimonas pentaromativorans]
MRMSALGSLVVLGSVAGLNPAWGADTSVESLKAQIDALSKKVGELEAKEEKSEPFAGVSIGGRLQLDYNLFDGAYNANHQGHTGSDLFARRARLFAEKESGDWDYKLLLEFAEDGAEITMARLQYKGFNGGPVIKLGKIREDISLEALSSSKYITTIERSNLADTFSPYFRWGVAAYQYFPTSKVRYAIGVYKNDAFGDSGKNKNNNLDLATTGRLTWAPIQGDGKTLHFGLWGSYREMGGDTLSSAFARGEVRETSVKLADYAAGGETVAIDHLTQYGLEAAGQWKAFSLQGEFAQRQLHTTDTTSPLDGQHYNGYSVTASYFLTGEQRQYKAGSAVFSQPKGVKNAWELYGRVSGMDAASDTQGTKVTSYTLGSSYYYSPQVKLMLNLIHSKVGGPGRAALVGDEDTGNALTFRTQYLF